MPVPTPRRVRSNAAVPAATSGTETQLRELRQRFIHSRADRGPCPSFSRLKADALPAVAPVDGKTERRDHLRLCDVCASRLRAWRGSWQFAADQSLAWSRVAAQQARRHGGHAARGLSRWIGRAAVASYGATRSAAASWRRRRREAAVRAARLQATPGQPDGKTVPIPSSRRPSLPRPGRARAVRGRPLVVIEEGPGLPAPATLAAHVEDRGGALAVVPRIEEVLGDRDWKQVRTVVLARPRPLAEWSRTLDRIERTRGARRAYALLPYTNRGAAFRDPRVVRAPLSEDGWEDLLERSGWIRSATPQTS